MFMRAVMIRKTVVHIFGFVVESVSGFQYIDFCGKLMNDKPRISIAECTLIKVQHREDIVNELVKVFEQKR